MAVPSGGVTKASVDGVGTKYDGEPIQDGILDVGATATFVGELRYSKTDDKVWVRARWDNTATHPSGPFLLAADHAGGDQPCGFFVDLQAEFKRADTGDVEWVTISTWGVTNTTKSVGTYKPDAFYDPDKVTHVTPYLRTGYFRVRIRTGVFNGWANGNDNKTYYSAKKKVK